MPYKTPKIPVFDDLRGVDKRVQVMQQNIAELDWLEYSFGLAKRIMVKEENIPVVYTGVGGDPLDMRIWPDDVYKAYAFWDLIDPAEFLYYDNVNALRRYPKVQQPVALIACMDNNKISPRQDYNVTHSLCVMELVNKINNSSIGGGVFTITSMLQNNITGVFRDYDVEDKLQEPFSCVRLEGMLIFTHDCL